MKNKRLLQVWILFGIVIIAGVILLSTTIAGKRNPETITQEDIANLPKDEKAEDIETGKGTSGVEDAVNTALSPVAYGTYSAATGVKGFFRRLFAIRDVDAEFTELKNRVIELETELSFYNELQAENERLQALLGFSEEYAQYEYVNAKIIASDTNSWFMEFTINRGEKHGITINLAVVNEDGLVGRIIEVYPTTSKVLSIIDQQSAVPIIAERSRDNGVASGTTNPESNEPEIRMNYLLSNADLIPGDKVISSSLMNVFPKGIVVGEVKEVIRQDSSERYAIITPAVDFSRLESLAVIIGDREGVVIGDSDAKDKTMEDQQPAATTAAEGN